MKRIRFILIAFIGTILFSQGCLFPKAAVDTIVLQSLKYRRNDIKEAVEFSILATYNSNFKQFPVSGIHDSMMRKKIEGLGSEVYVNYQNADAPKTIPDSAVIFTSIHDFGSVEIIYDFAAAERDISPELSRKPNAVLKRVSERTYYRRGSQSLLY